MRRSRNLIAAGLLILAVAAPAARGETGPSRSALPVLTLSMADVAHLPAEVLAAARQEVVDLFALHGVRIVWLRGAAGERPFARVVVTPSSPATLGLADDVMAVSLGMSRDDPTVYVFVGVVARVAGVRFPAPAALVPDRPWRLSRALARVLAHEIVHAVVPETGHANGGLMDVRQTDRDLVSGAPILQASFVTALRSQLSGLRRN